MSRSRTRVASVCVVPEARDLAPDLMHLLGEMERRVLRVFLIAEERRDRLYSDEEMIIFLGVKERRWRELRELPEVVSNRVLLPRGKRPPERKYHAMRIAHALGLGVMESAAGPATGAP